MIQKLAIIYFTLLILSCRKPEEVDPISLSDRQRVLNSIGSNVITAGFLQFQMDALGLKINAEQFINDPVSHQKLNNLKSAWIRCALTWKRASLFAFGPVDAQFILEGIYSPPDVAGIENLISNGSTVIDSSYVSGLGSGYKGILAIEYLIYRNSKGNSSEIIDSFTVHSNGGRRLAYLKALVASLQHYSNQTLIRWSRGGENYVQTFILSDGNDQNSSIGILVGRMGQLASEVRTERVGRPNGLFNNGIPQPDALDGKLSDESLALLSGEIDAIQSAFLGFRNASTNAVGVNHLLNIVANSTSRESLGLVISNQIDTVYARIRSIKTPMSHALVSNQFLITDLYKEIEILDKLINNEMREALKL